MYRACNVQDLLDFVRVMAVAAGEYWARVGDLFERCLAGGGTHPHSSPGQRMGLWSIHADMRNTLHSKPPPPRASQACG